MLKIILFDIDHTLFDSDLGSKLLLTSLSLNLNVSQERLLSMDIPYSSSLENRHDWNPDEFAKIVSKQLNLPLTKVLNVFSQAKLYKDCLYKDVVSSLSRLAAQSKLGIFSEGLIAFQTYKLKSTSLLDFFDKDLIFISRRKLDPKMLKKLPECSIVDDQEKICQDIQEFPNLTPIWLNRKNESSSNSVRTVHSLEELS